MSSSCSYYGNTSYRSVFLVYSYHPKPTSFKKKLLCIVFFLFFLACSFCELWFVCNCFLSVLKCLIVSSLYSVFLCGPFVTLCNTKNLLCVSFGFFCVSVYSAVSKIRGCSTSVYYVSLYVCISWILKS